jgi:hypothetical protein
MISSSRIVALIALQLAGLTPQTHRENNTYSRAVIGLAFGAVLGVALGSIIGLIIFVIFGWLLSGVSTYLGVNILPAVAGLYIGAVAGSLIYALASIVFVHSVNVAEESTFCSAFGAVLAWLTFWLFSSFESATQSVVQGATIGFIVGVITGLITGIINKERLESGFHRSSAHIGSAVVAAAFGVFVYPFLASSADTAIGLVLGLLIGVAAAFGSIRFTRKTPEKTKGDYRLL